MAAGIVSGALGDGLLRATPWGLNFFVWIVALAASAAGVLDWNRVDLTAGSRWLCIPLMFFAAAIAWRDSPVLKALNLIAIVVTLAMILMRSRERKLLAAGVTDYALSVLSSFYQALAGAGFLVARDIGWHEIPTEGWGKHLAPVAKGLLIALPLLLIFGGLLASADAFFSDLVARLFNWDFESIFVHSLLITVLAWAVAGFFRGVFPGTEIKASSRVRPGFLWLSVTEIVIILGLLDILFLGFVLVQFRYFFGGEARIHSIAGLTYAEYARSGFFELVTVAALVLPLLLAAHWLLRKDKTRDERIFCILAGIQIALLFVMIISAWQRMRLYQREYGLTELRVYTSAFMVWLAVIFVWFAATVLRGRREKFAFGAVMTGFLAIGALLALNPDRLIAGVNVEQALVGRNFDAQYVGSLSADAVPELIAALPKLNQSQQSALASRIKQRQPTHESSGWRRWNLSRAEAARALAERDQVLREYASR
jgi:Domain of unknown function (DUF4173)